MEITEDVLVIEHSPIITEKITRNKWIAFCDVIKPLKCAVSLEGKSEQEAVSRLKKFLQEDN